MERRLRGEAWGGSRRLLVPAGEEGLYHVVSRVVDRRRIFEEQEKGFFMRLVRRYARFGGLDVVSWCVMDNHFHLLVRVRPHEPGSLDVDQFLERLSAIYPPLFVSGVRGVLEGCGSEAERRELMAEYEWRMGNLASFMKDVKMCFTKWYNARHKREGALWSSRYRSTIVETEWKGGERGGGRVGGLAARVVSAYIDLNALRAGVVEDPGEYEWSSYGAALRGGVESRAGLAWVWGEDVGRDREVEEGLWERVQGRHRVLMFGEANEERGRGRDGRRAVVEAGRVWEERERGGRLPLEVLLRLRVRYMTAGGVLGSAEYVRRIGEGLAGNPGAGDGAGSERGGSGRVRKGVPMRYGQWQGLHSLRDLQKKVVSKSGDCVA